MPEKDDSIKEYGTTVAKTKLGNIQCLNIIGQIEGHMVLPSQNKSTKYEHVIPKLVEIEQDDDTEGLLIILNTVGGDVEAGLAIAEMISSMKTPTVSLVLGGGHSIGVPLAVSAKKSFIVPSATMTVHPIRMSGVVIGVSQTFEYFDRMQARVVSFVCRNSGISEQNFRSLMLKTDEIANDVGTVLFGDEAVKCGLIDCVGGLSDAVCELMNQIKDNRETSERKR